MNYKTTEFLDERDGYLKIIKTKEEVIQQIKLRKSEEFKVKVEILKDDIAADCEKEIDITKDEIAAEQKKLDLAQANLKKISYPIEKAIQIMIEKLKANEGADYSVVRISGYFSTTNIRMNDHPLIYYKQNVIYLKRDGAVIPYKEKETENMHIARLRVIPGIIIIYCSENKFDAIDENDYPEYVTFHNDSDIKGLWLEESLPDDYKYLSYEVAKHAV